MTGCQVSQVVRRPPRDQIQGSGCASALRGSNPLPGALKFFLILLTVLGTVMEASIVKELKERIRKEETNLQKLMNDTDKIWEDTGLDPKEPSYLVEKTMRFELAQKNIKTIFLGFNEIIENYKKLCLELEKSNLE